MEPDSFLTFLTQLLAYGGGSAAVAYLLFQYLGKTWIENKFSQRLEQMKYEQALEVQRLKVEIDTMLSRKIKLQDKEFDILPSAWDKLYKAFSKISHLLHPAQSHADVARMSDEQLDEFLEGTKFTALQKSEIKRSRDKGKTYQEILFWYHLHEVKLSFAELQEYTAQNGIFLEPKLKEMFTEISDTLWSAVISKEVGHEVKDWKMQREGWKQLEEEARPLYKKIEAYIHERLHSLKE